MRGVYSAPEAVVQREEFTTAHAKPPSPDDLDFNVVFESTVEEGSNPVLVPSHCSNLQGMNVWDADGGGRDSIRAAGGGS